MKRLAIITTLFLCSCLAAFGQWGDDAWKVEKTVKMPGVSKYELLKRAHEVLQHYPSHEYPAGAGRCYDYYYSQRLTFYYFDTRLYSKETGRAFRMDMHYDLAIYCYEGEYTVKITGIMPSYVHGCSFFKLPLDNEGASAKDAAFFDTLRGFLTDELEWHLPTVKRGMSTPS